MAVLQLKIALDDITPKIWRRFLVNDADSFQKLHETIQAVMGWSGCHLYRFYVGTEEIDVPNPDFSDFQKTTDARKTLLKERLTREKQKIGYVYDFGDFWEHTVTVEKILDDNSATKTPTCLEGARACPPEDCGGVGGYFELMELQKDKSDPEYKERITDWLGEGHDFERFDVGEANTNLEKMSRKGTGKKKPSYTGENQVWEKGFYAQSLDPKTLEEKLKTFHEVPGAKLEYFCKKCSKTISAHNRDWHNGMCDDCFNDTYFPVKKPNRRD